jgi:hypothetical protein
MYLEKTFLMEKLASAGVEWSGPATQPFDSTGIDDALKRARPSNQNGAAQSTEHGLVNSSLGSSQA